MKRWRVIVLVAVGAGMVVGLFFVARAAHGPTWKGRTVRSWVEDFRLMGGTGHERALAAIRAMGTNSIPELVILLRADESFSSANESALKRAIYDLLPSRLIPQSARLPASVHHWRAQTGLETLGPLAVPAVLELLSDRKVAERARAILMGIGSDGIPRLMLALTNGGHRSRVEAIRVLGWLKRDAETAVPELLTALHDKDKEIRDASAMAVYLISPDAASQAGLRWKKTSPELWRPPGRTEFDVTFEWPETSGPPATIPEPP